MRAVARAPMGGGSTKAAAFFTDFTNPLTPNPPSMTVVRTGTATYWDQTGTMQVAAINTPRIDFGPTPQNRQNYMFPSVFGVPNTSNWTRSGSTFIQNSTTAPDNSNTALLVVADTTNASHQATLTVDGNANFVLPNTQYTASAYVQAGTTHIVEFHLRVNANWVGGSVFGKYDLNAQTASVSGGTGTATITPLAGSWFRISVTGTTVASGLTSFPIFFLVDNAAGAGTYTGNGESAYIWGVQVEQGGTVTYPYLPTTTAAIINFTAKGLLVEEPRTNSVLQSAMFTSWVGTGATGTQNALLALDGTTSATLITEDSSTGVHQWAPAANPALVVNVPITFSYFVKDNGRGFCGISMFDATAPANAAFVDFDLTQGTAGTPTIGGAATSLTATIAPYGTAGWYRVSLTATLNSVANTGIITRARLESALGTVSYAGNGTASIYIWGAQVEAGTVPLSHIPTTTTTASRGSEDVQIPLDTWFRFNAPGTLFGEAMFKNVPPSNGNAGVVLITDSGASANYIEIWNQNASPNIFGQVKASGVAGVAKNHALTANTVANAAISWDGVNEQAGFSGTNSTTSPVGMPINLTRMIIGRLNTTPSLWAINGWVRKIGYYPRAMSAADLIAVTT